MRPWLALALCVPLLAGCLQSPGSSLPPGTSAQAAGFELSLPVHVVAVGFAAFDDAALLANVQPLLPQFQWIRAYTTGVQAPEPLQYKVDYRVHHAPEAFAQDLFAFAKTVARADRPDGSLANYDAAGEKRVCTPAPARSPVIVAGMDPTVPTCGDIQRIDAGAVEAWIAGNRAAHGLDFGAPGQTIFLLDSYTKGYLDPKSYHQYEVKADAQTLRMRTMRAWGGEHDFVFLDVGAAPNTYDAYPYGSYGPGAPNLAGVRDGPIWEYKQATSAFYANLGRNVGDAVRMLWARDPIYPFEYAERYVLPFYVFIDPNSHSNPDSPLAKVDTSDVPGNTDEAGIRKAFADLAPWANVTVEFHYVYLPDGDAAVAEVIKDAKDRSDKQSVDFGIVKRYFRENWAKYAPAVPGAKVYPTFAFLLDAPSDGIYAYSDGDEVGRSWGVFVNIADFLACVPAAKVPPTFCFTEDVFGGPDYWWAWWNSVLAHELGHSFGLTHTHDTAGLATAGQLTYDLNWLWDSTASVMTYRHTLGTFDAFDKELVLRNHAANLALRALQADGSDRGALERLAKGDYAGAFGAAQEAARLLPGLLDARAAGARGTTATLSIEVPATSSPLGVLDPMGALPVAPPVNPLTATHRFPILLPANATAFEIEVREGDAPSHSGWAAYVLIADAGGNVVGALTNNGYDIGVWEALDKCLGTCHGILVPYSGAQSAYTVNVTPLFGYAPWPKA